jgi:hypothetical protein
MKMLFNLLLVVVAGTLSFLAVTSHADCPSQPELSDANFLFTEIAEFNVDFAIAWTDSVASIFLHPIDAVILHIEMDGVARDVFVFSDAGQNRLTTFVCTSGEERKRDIVSITAYDGEDAGYFKMPMGIATNAVGRQFDPQSDLLYVADKANDRILMLSVEPEDQYVCRIRSVGSFGEQNLEYPVDIAISAYKNEPENADFYVVDWGHEENAGELVRFDKDGNYEYDTPYIYYPETERIVAEINRPVAVSCYPDTMDGRSRIYVVEAANNTLFELISDTGHHPENSMIQDLMLGVGYWNPGGIAHDGCGRIYIVNTAAVTIECYGPSMECRYQNIGNPEFDGPALSSPLNMIIDTYYGFCEALLLETYYRQSGLRSFTIEPGVDGMVKQLGFRRGEIIRPAKPSAEPLPLIYSLRDPYPNPFNSECKIGFSLPEESRVTIEVFDALGRKVVKLLNKTLSAGEHSVTFDAADLSSGTYFYKMTAGRFSQTKQMVLVK